MNQRMPTAFISHGSPMHAIDAGAAGKAWHALAEHINTTHGKPRAIVMASAHWETNIPMVTGAATPATIHDFGGFPAALYRIQYRAPGDSALAEYMQALLHAAGICTGIESHRGLDHGAWSPLLHMYTQADVPVIQLAMQTDRGARHHLAMGRALHTLRDQGVLIIGSGHMTHNLRDHFALHAQAGVAQYASEFRNWVDVRVRQRQLAELADWNVQAPAALRAHPSAEHFLPLFVALGAASENYTTHTVFSGFDGPVLAMDAYRFD